MPLELERSKRKQDEKDHGIALLQLQQTQHHSTQILTLGHEAERMKASYESKLQLMRLEAEKGELKIQNSHLLEIAALEKSRNKDEKQAMNTVEDFKSAVGFAHDIHKTTLQNQPQLQMASFQQFRLPYQDQFNLWPPQQQQQQQQQQYSSLPLSSYNSQQQLQYQEQSRLQNQERQRRQYKDHHRPQYQEYQEHHRPINQDHHRPEYQEYQPKTQLQDQSRSFQRNPSHANQRQVDNFENRHDRNSYGSYQNSRLLCNSNSPNDSSYSAPDRHHGRIDDTVDVSHTPSSENHTHI